jgi:hypothetical protein
MRSKYYVEVHPFQVLRAARPHYRFEHVRRLGGILHGRVHRHFAVVLSAVFIE